MKHFLPPCAPVLIGLIAVLLIYESITTPPAVSQPTRPPVVCIDPGHPSEVNEGRAVQHGTTEVAMNWAVAVQLKKALLRRGVAVVMTKSSVRQLVTNKERAQIANLSHAAVMVRLHCDTGSGSGFALYYPAQTGTKEGVTGPSRAVRTASREAAMSIHRGMSRLLVGKLKDNGIKTDSQTYIGKRQGALTGSIFSQVPVVLIEMVFLSNARDAAFIKSQSGQRQLAEAMAEGITQYLTD